MRPTLYTEHYRSPYFVTLYHMKSYSLILGAVLSFAAIAAVAPTHAQAAALCSFTRDMTVGTNGEDVRCLQQYLNGSGFIIAAAGVGSPGHETTEFKTLTQAAVMAWQAANGINPATGYFGAVSRAKYVYLTTVSSTPPPVVNPPAVYTPPPTTSSSANLSAQSAVKKAITQIKDAADQIDDADDDGKDVTDSKKEISKAYDNLFDAVDYFFRGIFDKAEDSADHAYSYAKRRVRGRRRQERRR